MHHNQIVTWWIAIVRAVPVHTPKQHQEFTVLCVESWNYPSTSATIGYNMKQCNTCTQQWPCGNSEGSFLFLSLFSRCSTSWSVAPYIFPFRIRLQNALPPKKHLKNISVQLRFCIKIAHKRKLMQTSLISHWIVDVKTAVIYFRHAG